MAKAQGIRCDVCNLFEITPNADVSPDGWITVVLPHSPSARPEDYQKDLCSDRCMEKLGKARRQATHPGTGRSRMDAALADFLDSKGVSKSKRGSTVRNHTAGGHDRNPSPACLICEFAMQDQASA